MPAVSTFANGTIVTPTFLNTLVVGGGGTSLKGLVLDGTGSNAVTATARTVEATGGALVLLSSSGVSITTGPFDSPYSRQSAITIATTNATPTGGTIYTIAASEVIHVIASIIGRKDNSTCGAYCLAGAFRYDGATATQIGTTQAIHSALEDDAAWAADLGVSGLNVVATVTGAAATNIAWRVSSRITKIA